jgi:hypothetical protein
MADNKGQPPQRPERPERPQDDFQKSDKGGRVTSDQAPPQRPRKG